MTIASVILRSPQRPKDLYETSFRVFLFIVCFSILIAPYAFSSTACVEQAGQALNASHNCGPASDCCGCVVEKSCSDESPAGLGEWARGQTFHDFYFEILISSNGFSDFPSQFQPRHLQGELFFTPRLYSLYSEFRI